MATPSPRTFSENTGSGTCSSGTALPVSGAYTTDWLFSFSLLITTPPFLLVIATLCISYATVCINYTFILHEVQCIFVFSTFLTIFTYLFCAVFHHNKPKLVYASLSAPLRTCFYAISCNFPCNMFDSILVMNYNISIRLRYKKARSDAYFRFDPTYP